MASASITIEEPEIPANRSKANFNIALQTSSSQKRLLPEEEALEAEEEPRESKPVRIRRICREWMKKPKNIVFLTWLTCVAISGSILFLVITGMLDKTLTTKPQRDLWFEVNNQILNALFTLMCLYHHPRRFHLLFLLCRWKRKDSFALRQVFCKNATCKPNERVHLMVVVLLLHVNCFAQYALCGLNLGYKRSERPHVGVAVCLSIAIAAPALAVVYAIVSPLGKENGEEEDQNDDVSNNICYGNRSCGPMEKRHSFQPSLNSLPHEDKATHLRTTSSWPIWSSPRLFHVLSEEELKDLEFPRGRNHSTMKAPVP